MRSVSITRFVWVAGVHGASSLALQAFLLACHAPATLWPPAGISLGFLVIWGRQYWLAVALGTVACLMVHTELAPLQVLLLSLVSGTAARTGAWAIERIGGVRLSLPSVRDMALLCAGGLFVAPLLSAIGGTLVLLPTRPLGATTFSSAAGWWFTEALGGLAFTPMVVAWYGVRERIQRASLEWTAFIGTAVLSIATLLLVTVRFSGAFALLALSMVPVALWSAQRFGLRCTMTLNAAVALATAIGFASGHGLFAMPPSSSPLAAQLFTTWTVLISLGFAASVRERGLVVERLRESENRLTSVLNSSHDQIALLSVADGRVAGLEVGNRALFAGLRVVAPELRAEDLFGRSRADVSAQLAESLQSIAQLRQAVNDTLSKGKATTATHEVKTRWGERVLEATIVPIFMEGSLTHVVWQSRDVTDRVQAERALRASEARWRSLIEASPQFIMLVDPAGRLTFINRVAEGFRPSDVLGTPLEDYMVDEESRSLTRTNLAAVFDGETRRYEVRAQGNGTAPAWYRCDAGPVWDQGKVVAAILLASDITDQRRAEGERQLLEQQLYQSQKMEALGTLAGGIAHDFNNVLAAIMANAELLHDSVAHDADANDSLRDILSAGRRARDVVRQILAFSRRQPLERRAVRLCDVILEAMTLLRASLPTTIRLRTTVRASDVRVLADETQLHQVVMNLATNAAQAIGEAEGDIEFDATVIDVRENGARAEGRPPLPPGRYARLAVKDNGPGMDGGTLARIFDPFFTTKPMGQGTGLGLAVVHGIVSSHSGTITADSEVGRGTTMAIYLPLYEEPATVEGAPASVSAAA